MPEEPKAEETPSLEAIVVEKAGALDPKDSVKTAGDRMREHNAETWPVVEDRKLVGMVDEKDPDWKMGGHGHDPKSWRVGQIMRREVVYCYEDQDCATARGVMEEHGLAYLPVVDRQMRIVGIFSRDEISKKAEVENPEGKSA